MLRIWREGEMTRLVAFGAEDETINFITSGGEVVVYSDEVVEAREDEGEDRGGADELDEPAVRVTARGLEIDASRMTKVSKLGEDCTICFQPLNEAVMIERCKHVYHFRCLAWWCEEWAVCPICREGSVLTAAQYGYVKKTPEMPTPEEMRQLFTDIGKMPIDFVGHCNATHVALLITHFVELAFGRGIAAPKALVLAGQENVDAAEAVRVAWPGDVNVVTMQS